MDQTVLVSALGWRPFKLLEPYKRINPDYLVILHTQHDNTLAALGKVEKALAKLGAAYEAHAVEEDFDFAEWYSLYDGLAKRFSDDEVIVNTTAGHGFGITMAAAVAIQRGLTCVFYDFEDTKEIYEATPAVVMSASELTDTDKRVLEELSSQPSSVSDLAKATSMPVSTTSTALTKLRQKGWVSRARKGQSAVYEVREPAKRFYGRLRGGQSKQ